jgi:1-deoxy-D-xylulose-5-phosphate reductoisomerase
MKNIAILGSTGSIGKSALDVVRHHPKQFKVVALSTNSNISLLQGQVEEFRPKIVCVNDARAAEIIRAKFRTRVLCGEKGLREIAASKEVHNILIAISGFAALLPLLEAIERGKDIALANKEALVAAGPIIMLRAHKKKAKIIPVDSEQSAIWQCLNGNDRLKLKNIYLTASGGPLRKAKDFKNISLAGVLRHPRWKMGKKITVDSATLMNKGLELLEAMFLFNVPCEKVKILIHPEAIIHSMVEFIDGVVMAQLSATDMRIPIQYALSYPERLSSNSFPAVDFYKLKELHFEEPDFKRFPCLGLAYRAARALGTMPAVLNAANEACVEGFLNKRLRFISIPEVIERVMDRHSNKKHPDLCEIQDADSWARREALKVIESLN